MRRFVHPLVAVALVSAALLGPRLLRSLAQPMLLRSFDRVQLLEDSAFTSASASIGDIDHDGDLDIILAKGRHWPLNNLVFRNDGKAHFTKESLADAPDRTYTAALADLNGDVHLDLVVSNDRPDRKLVYLNDGTGHFRVSSTFGDSTWSTRYVTVADLNGDHRPDIIVANRSSNAANPRPSFVCLNDGAGAFPSCKPLPTQSATIIVAVDLDGDGFIDLFVPHRDGGQSLIFWNDGTGKFNAGPTLVGGAKSNVRAAAAADINADGIVDLVVGDEQTGLFYLLGMGHRAFASPIKFGIDKSAPYAIVITDMNKDKMPDIVVGNFEAPGVVYFNQGTGATPTFSGTLWNDGKGAMYGVAVGDLDGDGWPDIVGARSDAPNGIWFNGPVRRP